MNDFGFDNFKKLATYGNVIRLYDTYYSMPRLYIVTPTYKRKTQIAELTRLKNALWNVPKVHWIVIEDATNKTYKIANFLWNSKLSYTHLNEPTPRNLSQIKIDYRTHFKHKAAAQRNVAIQWLREHAFKVDPDDVVYFADDDNSYHLRLFQDVFFIDILFIFIKVF